MTPFWQTAVRATCTGKAEIEEAIRLDQGTICIGDLIGLGIEKVKKLDRPAIVKVAACATVDVSLSSW
jgi:hypothetical protein